MILSEAKRRSVCSSQEVADLFRKILESEKDVVSQEREHFWSIGLNTKNVTQYIELVSLGTLTASLVHPRECFRFACIKGVAAMVIAHNHPSGDTRPSQDDILLTKRLVQAGDLLGIKVLDHIIIGNDTNQHFSFRDNGLMS